MSEMSIAEKTDEILKQIRLLNYRTDLSAAIADFFNEHGAMPRYVEYTSGSA